MQWLVENWFLVLLIGAMAAMHLFGHGSHGGQKRTALAKRHRAHDQPDAPSADPDIAPKDA